MTVGVVEAEGGVALYTDLVQSLESLASLRECGPVVSPATGGPVPQPITCTRSDSGVAGAIHSRWNV
jgi:hypothetical protein